MNFPFFLCRFLHDFSSFITGGSGGPFQNAEFTKQLSRLTGRLLDIQGTFEKAALKQRSMGANAVVTISRHGQDERSLRGVFLSAPDVPDWTLKVLVPVDTTPTELPIQLLAFGNHHYGQSAEKANGPPESDVKSMLLIFKEVLDHLPDHRIDIVWKLSHLYVKHFKWSRQVSDLDRGVSLLREYMDLRNMSQENRIVIIRNLAVSMVRPGYWETHAPAYLDYAISLYNEVMEFQKMALPTYHTPESGEDTARTESASEYLDSARTPDSSTDITYTLDELAYCYKSRFEQRRKVEDLDMANQLIHEHMALCKNCKIQHPACLHVWGNLAGVYGHRRTVLRAVDDLDESINLYRRCLDCWRTNAASLQSSGLWHSQLSNVLTQRFTEKHERRDIDEAIDIDRDALALFKPGDSRYRASLHHLGNSLMIRSQWFNEENDLEDCIQAFEEAGPVARTNLSSALEMRFKVSRNKEDWNQSIKLAMQALEDYPPGHAMRSGCLSKIAMLLITENAPGYDVHKALQYRLEALQDDSCSPQERLGNSAWMFNHVEVEKLDVDTQSLFLEVLVSTMRLLPHAADFSMGLELRLQHLQREDEVVIQAASQAISLDQAGRALEILEEGRAIFWAQSLRLRAPFEDVPEPHRSRLIQRARELYDRSLIQLMSTNSKSESDAEGAYRRRLHKKFNEELQMLGKDLFLPRLSVSDIVKVAEQGPVVVLLATRVSCDAILITQNGDVQRVKLHITAEELGNMGERLKTISREAREAYMRLGDKWDDYAKQRDVFVEDQEDAESLPFEEHSPSPRAGGGFFKVGKPRDEFSDHLQVLWIKVVKPILDALRWSGPSRLVRSRIWWCPTGPFTFLPIHAAGTEGECCSDYVISSYTPTLQSLIDSRHMHRSSPPSRSHVKALVAAVSKGFTGSLLVNVVPEVKQILQSLPVGSILPLSSTANSTDSTEGVTVKMMLDNLPEATLLHLACHGTQDAAQPLESGFIMQDGLLRISDLMALSNPAAFMAFLSACETAKGDMKQPDQTVHLAAAMLFAGFKSVVATMWSMNDQDGPTVAGIVYGRLFAGNSEHLNPGDVAYAIDMAMLRLKRAGYSPSRWAPYIHIGI